MSTLGSVKVRRSWVTRQAARESEGFSFRTEETSSLELGGAGVAQLRLSSAHTLRGRGGVVKAHVTRAGPLDSCVQRARLADVGHPPGDPLPPHLDQAKPAPHVHLRGRRQNSLAHLKIILTIPGCFPAAKTASHGLLTFPARSPISLFTW